MPFARTAFDVAARRSRAGVRGRARELPRAALPIAQAAFAAALSWVIAREVLGHEQPFFAPVAAILTLGLSYGQRGRRAVEIPVGVALGIGVGDVLVLALGTGAWQVGVVVALAMVAAILLGGGQMLVSQAAVSAVLVATLQPPTDGLSLTRLLDALVGGVVAMLVNVLAPTDPLRLVRREAEPLLEELAGTLDDIAAALSATDATAAQAALERARAIDASTARFREALEVGYETARVAPVRRRSRGPLQTYAAAVNQVDHAVRNTRVLARGALRAIEMGERVPPGALAAIGDLAAAVRALAPQLADPERDAEAQTAATRAAARATEALEETGNLSASVIVGQVRSTAADLLTSLGLEPDEARSAVREARSRLAAE